VTAARRLREYYAAHPVALDLTLLAIVTIAACVLRLVLLGQIPYGVHSDEAQLGTDGRKILDGELWTVYTKAVLGQPTGHAYLTLPSFLILGWTPLAMRLPLALVGLAAVPLLYLFVRQGYGRAHAFFAAAMLAVSWWHLFYSRVAHWSISYGTITLAVLLCLLLGMNTRKRGWFVAAGALLGLGFYTYNIYPVAVAAVIAFIAIITYTRYRGDAWPWWRGSMLMFGAAAIIVAAPMLIYVADPGSFYWFHVRNYQDVGLFRSPEFQDEDLPGKVRLLFEQLDFFAGAYAYDAQPDIVDGNGTRPVFDPATLVLLGLGLLLLWRERRNPVAVAAFCCFVIIPLPAVLQRGSVMRQPVAAAPFAMFIAAIPLAAAWQAAREGWAERSAWPIIAAGAVCLMLAIVTATTVRDYFWTWRDHDWPRFIYYSQMTTASDYMREELPDDTFVLFHSDRASFYLETRQFLARDVQGADRSFEFSDFGGSIEVFDRSRTTVFILMESYVDLLPSIEQEHPGGRTKLFSRDGKFEFAAYELPPE
jgi:MYXO-CTERM domain-containing protein